MDRVDAKCGPTGFDEAPVSGGAGSGLSLASRRTIQHGGCGLAARSAAAAGPAHSTCSTWITAGFRPGDPINRVFDAVAPVFHEHMTKGKGFSEEEYQKRREASRKQPAGGVNCALFFARHLRKSLDRPIGLVPNSPGGSSMEHWNPARRNEGGNSFTAR